MSGHREESRGVGRPSWAAGAVAALVAATGAIAAAPADDWRPLFDGAKLGAWRATEFGGEGAVEVVGDAIRIGMGSPLSGITWGGEFPRQRFELSLEARRVEGHDFFCGLTFPVGPDSCSLILGGWGGGLVGLSSIDGEDASSNQTTQYREFKDGVWHDVTVRVTPEKIECFLDGEPIIDQPLAGRRISIRPEVIASQPLGIACYATTAEVRGLRWRPIPEEPRP
jgi:hypothetical protein